MTHQIGILFWGCKGGHRNFCDNGVIDVYSNEIRQTYKDVRSFATFSVVNTDFYALEFTSEYKVYTHYRSSNDSGSGAFIAVSIYVPNSLQVKDIRYIMDKMMDDYFEQYFNPITNSPIPGMVDDITPFQQMFDAFAADRVVPDKSRFFKRPSKQDDTPKVLAYSNVDELDAYFASPYRPEFFQCQEVMFISKEIFQNQAQYGLRFQIPPTLIEHVSEPEPEPFINFFPRSDSFRLTQFQVNGKDFTAQQGDVPLYDGDRLSMRIEGNRYQKPIIVENAPIDQVVQAGLIKKNGKGYEFLPVYSLDYAQFNVQAKIEGDETGTLYRCFALRSLDDPKLIISGSQYDSRSQMFVFGVSGQYLPHHFELIYSVTPTFAKDTLIIPLKKLDIETLITDRTVLQLSVQKHIINIACEAQAPTSINFQITSSDKNQSIEGTIVNPSAKTELYLPSSFTFNAEDVRLQAPEFNIKLDPRGRFVISPKTIEVEVAMPRYLENIDISALIPTYKIGDETYKGTWNQRKCYLKLPFDWTQMPGKLILSGVSFQFEEISRSMITFRCSVVSNRTGKPMAFDVIFEDGSTQSRKLKPNSLDILPASIDVRISPEFKEIATVEEKGFTTDNKTKLFILVPHQMSPSSSSSSSPSSESSNSSSSSSSSSSESTSSSSMHGFEIDEQPQDTTTDRVLSKITSGQPSTQGSSHQTDDQQGRHPGEFTHERQRNNASGGNQGSENHNQSRNNANRPSGNGGNNRPSPKPAQSYFVRLMNCESFYARLLQSNGTYKVVPIANLDTSDYIEVNANRAQVKLLDSREREVCVVNFPKSEYDRDTVMAQRNSDNDFDVNWVDDNRCMVHYRKKTLFNKIRNTLNANKKLLAGVISVLIIALVTALWMFIEKRSEDYDLDIRFSVNAPGNVQGLISHVGYNGLEFKGDSLVLSHTGDILNIQSEVNPRVIPSEGGVYSDLYVVYRNGQLVPILKQNVYNDSAYEAVIFPQDIRMLTMDVNPPRQVRKDAGGIVIPEKEFSLDSLFFLLSNPKRIDTNITVKLVLPPYAYLKSYMQLARMSEIDDKLIDSLASVYPDYRASILKIKEPEAGEAEGESTGEDQVAAETATPTTPDTPMDPNVVAPVSDGKDTSKDAAKTTPDNKAASDKDSTPTNPASGTESNATIIKTYNAKVAKLDGIFTKAMVDDLLAYQYKHENLLKSLMVSNSRKVNAYRAFVNHENYNVKDMTPTQEVIINTVKAVNPTLVESRDYPAIYNEYKKTGGKQRHVGDK